MFLYILGFIMSFILGAISMLILLYNSKDD